MEGGLPYDNGPLGFRRFRRHRRRLAFYYFLFFFLKTKEERRNDDDGHTNFRFGFCAWREETNGRKIAPGTFPSTYPTFR